MKPSDFQTRVLLVPEQFDLFLGGGRGGGKSAALALLALRHVEQCGAKARVLYIRRTYSGLADFENETRMLFGSVYPSARYNGAAHTWRFPSGAIMELGQIDGPQDYQKFQGRSFSLILADEITQYADFRLLDLLRSNLRAPADVVTRCCYAGNPGGIGHMAVARRYVFNRIPWVPFTDAASGRQAVHCPSTLVDNPVLDQAAYRRSIEASTAGDPELLKAWLHGDWHIARGAYFSDVVDERRVMIDDWPLLPPREVPRKHLSGHEIAQLNLGLRAWPTWYYRLSHDFGVSAPAVTYLVAESPGAEGPDGRYYPRNSLILVDEHDTRVSDDDLNNGRGQTVPELAQEILAMAAFWKVGASGVADDAIFARTGSSTISIAHEFERCGVHFRPAGKADRISGWQRMRLLLQQAGMPDKPGLYVARRCTGWWATVPFLARDARRREDVDSRGPDHWADACRYACSPLTTGIGVLPIRWAR